MTRARYESRVISEFAPSISTTSWVDSFEPTEKGSPSLRSALASEITRGIELSSIGAGLTVEWPAFPEGVTAWILATNKKFLDPPEAVKLAEFACGKTIHKNPVFLNTLAAAYASANRNSEAIQIAQKALKLAQSTGKTELAAKIQTRLQMYMASQP